jgi:feruloyl esterase
MPLCKFPQQAKYKGAGDVNDAANWSCADQPSLLDVGPNGIEAGLREK